MQVGGGNAGVGGTVKNIVNQNGILGLYNGLSAAFLRQWMYGSGRMGIFSFLMQRHKAQNAGNPGLAEKLGFGVIAGGIGAFCGTPAEVAIVRMAADGREPDPAKRQNYKSVVDCLARTYREEGLANGLYKGATVTVVRAAVLGAFQMGVYAETKEKILQWDEKREYFTDNGVPIMFVSALNASLYANAASLPFDVVKSRIQNMPRENPPYTGMIDCARKSIAQEGVMVLWKGFTPAFVKLAPYTILSLSFLEKLTFLATGKGAM